MKKLFIALGGVLLLGLIGIHFVTRAFTVSQDELQAQADKLFQKPVTLEGGGVKLTLEKPVVRLQSGSSRIGVEISATVSALGREGSGRIAASGEVVYEDRAFRAYHFQIEGLKIEGMSEFWTNRILDQVKRVLGDEFVSKLIPSLPIYRLSAEDLSKLGLPSFAHLRDVTITDGTVIIKIGLGLF